MQHKLLIIQTAALSGPLDVEGLAFQPMQSVFPAVTCTAQASFRTAAPPAEHGMVANGRFHRVLNRPMFWEQSAKLVSGERIWDRFRKSGKRVAMLFWQQSLGENADILLSPAPIHKHGGGMIQSCYSKPAHLYDALCQKIGRSFKLQHYWGPLASWKAGEWIVDATCEILTDPELSPDLCLTYLPTLDYDLQRKDPCDSPAASSARERLCAQMLRLMQSASRNDYAVVVFGDYHIAPVSGAVYPNRLLRNAGLMKARSVRGRCYPDYYESRAFAVVDHQVAHVYIDSKPDVAAVRRLFESVPGIAGVLDAAALAECGAAHENAGELVLIAGEGQWLAYPWWERRREAPDFAAHVDIHNKPGYDPCELFFGWPPGTVSLNTDRIRGSHGCTGPGRETVWASTIPLGDAPKDLIGLAQAVKQVLDRGDT